MGEFKPGDVVQLKSGGTAMVVIGVDDEYGDITVMWHEPGVAREGVLGCLGWQDGIPPIALKSY